MCFDAINYTSIFVFKTDSFEIRRTKKNAYKYNKEFLTVAYII